MSRFKNTFNDYEEYSSDVFSWLWCLLFGCIYFAVKGNWRHAFASLGWAIVTFGVSWFIYPFFVYGINDKHYERQGWRRLE